MPPVRIGIIGAGWFASRRHCPDLVNHPSATLSALCRRNPEQLRQMADHFGVETCFTDHRELVQSGAVDAVVICSPHHLHYEHTRAALENDLHVLLEKPITLDPGEGRRLVELAAAKGLTLVVAQNPPYWNHCRYLRQQIQQGTLGDIEGVHIHWMNDARGVLGLQPLPDTLPGVVKPTQFRHDPEQNGGGFFIDGGSHLVCELLWCTDLEVVEVTAQMDDPEWDLNVALTLLLNNGALATITMRADSAIFDKRHHSIYYGTAGTAIFRGFPFELSLEAQGSETIHRSEKELPAPPSPVDNLVDCILDCGAPELDNGAAVHIVEIINAAYESARSGRSVKL